MDVSIRFRGVLEPQDARSDLFQSAGGAIYPATHYQEDGVGIGWTVQSRDYRWHQGIRDERTASPGTGRDVLHDVEPRISKRLRRALASAFDVLHPPNRSQGLGCGSAWLPGYVESTISGCPRANNRVYDSSRPLVGRDGCYSQG